MFWISSEENPGRERVSFLSRRSSVTVSTRHSCSSGMGKYFSLFFTHWGVSKVMSETLHCLHKLSRVLPSTVLLSLSNSLARSLTQSLVLEMRDLWKVTYLEDNMTLGVNGVGDGFY